MQSIKVLCLIWSTVQADPAYSNAYAHLAGSDKLQLPARLLTHLHAGLFRDIDMNIQHPYGNDRIIYPFKR
jgi:hypothetical protein